VIDGALGDLAAFAVGRSELPASAIDKARACLLYGLSVAIAAHDAPEPAIALRAQRGEPPDPAGATRLLDGATCVPGQAALANAVLMHARVQEDAHPAGHVGVVVLPAALACAQAARARGCDLLAAIAVGYEVALRIGRDHAGVLSERGFRTTSVYGPFGAAAACARLAGLDAAAARDALALAASAAGGLREFVEAGSQDYAFQAGFAARDGIACAALAAAGARGAASALEGQAGFFRAFGGDPASCGARVTDRLGSVWELDRVAFKPYPVCQFHRAVVTGVLALRERAGAAPADRLEVRMHPFEADFFGVRHPGPFGSFAQAFMSAPYCAALAWVRGEVTYRGLTGPAGRDVAALAQRVQVIADAACPRYRPRIRVVTDSGREFAWDESGGEDDYRLDWERAVAMNARLLAEARVPEALRIGLVENVAALSTAADVGGVVSAAVGACAAARAAAG